MPLDPEIAVVLKSLEDMPPMERMSLAELRASVAPVPSERRAPVAAVRDLVAGLGIPLRQYTPLELASDRLIVYFHGGGFVIGDLETHDHLCRDLANASGCSVVAVDYRRAPECRFPIPLDDCIAAVRWIAANDRELGVSTERLILAGDSAGANLATVTALRLREEGGPRLVGQLLAYPVTDYHTPATPSYLENAEGYSLTRNAMIRFWQDYVATPEQGCQPYAAPLRAPSLAGLPAALVMTAQFDPLRDEGDAYARRLAESGVAVTHLRYDGLIHGFLRMAMVSRRAREAFADIRRWVDSLP